MKNLVFNRLLVRSNSTKLGNQFTFSPTLNLITARDNNVGKSTLAKLLFWSFGCEPFFDTTWQKYDCETILFFSLGDKEYKIHRYQKSIVVIDDSNKAHEFQGISGFFSQFFAELVNFKALLPNRNDDKIETPPPAFYFLPFYIDQQKSWASAWSNFDRLGQYSTWQRTIINYHVGLLVPRHFEIDEEIYQNKYNKKLLETNIEKLNTAIEVVDDFSPIQNNHISEEQFQYMTDDIKAELTSLSKKQENLLEKVATAQSDYAYLSHQLVISEKIIKELDADYKFAVENIEEEIECPLCGVVHENSIINKASILTDKQQAETQYSELQTSLNKTQRKIEKLNSDTENIRNEIQNINQRYSNGTIDDDSSFQEVIESFAVTAIAERVRKSKEDNYIKIKETEDSTKKLKEEKKGVLTKDYIDDLLNDFTAILTKNIKALQAQGVNLSQISKPTDGSKIIREGGAAEGTRGILAYYLTIFSLIKKYGNESLAPLVIDTPNQHEQSFTNYDKIVDLLINEFSPNDQVFICAMENKQLEPYAIKANVIFIDENKILRKDIYTELESEFLIL